MRQQADEFSDLTARVWGLAGGTSEAAARVTVSGPRTVLRSAFDVTGLAAASVAAAALAAAEYHAVRNAGPAAAVRVDTRGACAAFAAQSLFAPIGWSVPELWDPIAGNYQASDGWIRLHTNYAHHRVAVTRLLKADDGAAVQAAVSSWQAADLENAVVGAGGCAAAMHDRASWLASAAGAATADAAPLTAAELPLPAAAGDAAAGPAGQPYAGVRVLDLTRVIAGPVCTKFLAAYGADVLRLDPPGFAEVPALLPETTAGKRTAAVDLTAAAGRADFERLVSEADVLVTGLRADALDRLGYDDAALTALNPALVIASLNAYGWDGPWRGRRGFDSLVQMSCGIAAADSAGADSAGADSAGADSAAAGAGHPVPLPVQALDHGCGYVLAAAVGRALTVRLTRSAVTRIRASLVGTANLLWSFPRPSGTAATPGAGEFALAGTRTAWGPARRVPVPGEIAGISPVLRTEAGPLGRHQPAWLPR